ncbi:hypothetical protein AVEN_2091-1 [Araneus ventricosus]|uniref:Uncharacterized protein n=1 Tax=Araneus ventricosus TaxID=182803 RepID=A0A4Y2X6G0_ARAVE|nr:hypothetical protein AVEN_2091-1 [Araneus ventricosus]
MLEFRLEATLCLFYDGPRNVRDILSVVRLKTPPHKLPQSHHGTIVYNARFSVSSTTYNRRSSVDRVSESEPGVLENNRAPNTMLLRPSSQRKKAI